MIDSEVMRLRRLRTTALQVRALAAVLDTPPGRRPSAYSRLAQCCWQIARLATGTLRAHPYPPFQRDISAVSETLITLAAQAQGRLARQRGLGFQAIQTHARRVARQLADARALTWHQDLSDTFGRLQAQLMRLSSEVAAGAAHEAQAQGRAIPALAARQASSGAPDRALDDNWPYLAF